MRESDDAPEDAEAAAGRGKRSALGEHVGAHLIDSRRLFYFSQVAKLGSFTAAEAALDVSQSTLSRQLQLLEEEVGATLLVRASRGVSTTHAGEILLAQADLIMHEMELAREQISAARRNTGGRVSIAASRPFSSRYFPGVVTRFLENHPDIRLTVLEGSSGHVHQYLADGVVDLAVVLHNPNTNKIVTRKLLTEPLLLVMRSDHPCANATVIDRSRLTELDLVLPAASHGTRLIIERYFQDGGLDLDPSVRMDSVSLMRAVIAQGSRCAILPEAAFAKQLASGLFVAKPLRPALNRSLYLAWLRERNRSAASAAMEAEIVAAVENGDESGWAFDDA